MLRTGLILSFLLAGIYTIAGQSRAELEAERRRMLDEIAYADTMLQTTRLQRTAGLNELKLITSRIDMRETIIQGIRSEMDLVNYRIELNTLSSTMMTEDLEDLREEYASSIRAAYRFSKGSHPLMFILSAQDFNQGYRRIRYMQQTASYRRRQASIIQDIVVEISRSIDRLDADRQRLVELQREEEAQRAALLTEQNRRQQLNQQLSRREQQLAREIEEKRNIAGEIQEEINRIIEAEQQAAMFELTPEQILAGSDFESNKGALPWPVERGIITSRFGTHQHMVNRNVISLDNIGIDINTTNDAPVRSVFRGEVTRVWSITGGNMAIIIRHGSYMTVYQNLVNVRVRPGDRVQMLQAIGDVYVDGDRGNTGVVTFMIFHEMERYDPEEWLAPRR